MPHPLNVFRSRTAHLFRAVLLVLGVALATLYSHVHISAQGHEKSSTPHISGTVILGALKEDEPRPTAEELQEFEAQLKEIFGYDTFRVAGVKREPLSKEGQKLEIKTKNFSMQLEYTGSETHKNGPGIVRKFKVKLFQRDELIVQGDVEVPNGEPFYVKGPVWGRKEIILMILVR